MNQEQCPKCNSQNIYQDRELWVCPECSHEWLESSSTHEEDQGLNIDNSVKDANGNILNDGDSVLVVKDLKIKGSTSSVKSGTKVKNINLGDAGDGHNIMCKIDGVGSINLKSEFVRKV